MIYFFLAIISLVLFFFINKISIFYSFYDQPNKSKIHKEKTPNIAGVMLIPYFTILLFFFEISNPIKETIYIFILVVIFGFIDDLKDIKPEIKLILLFLPIYLFSNHVGMILSLGEYEFGKINLGKYSFIFTILCIFLLTNAYNYIDGLDGLLSSNLIITLFFLIFLSSNSKYIFIVTIIFLSVYTFFNFNFLNIFPKQFIGDSGSLGLGFLISSILILFTQVIDNIHPSIIIWTVAFVVYEFLTINIIRIKNKKNILNRDLNFIFNIFENKFSSIISLLLCSLIHIFFCLLSIILNYFEYYFLSLILFVLIFFLYLIFRLKQFKIS